MKDALNKPIVTFLAFPAEAKDGSAPVAAPPRLAEAVGIISAILSISLVDTKLSSSFAKNYTGKAQYMGSNLKDKARICVQTCDCDQMLKISAT